MADLKGSLWNTRNRWGNNNFQPARKFNGGYGPSPTVTPANPEPSSTNTAQSSAHKTTSDLERYDRLLRRVEWKCRLLFASCRLANQLADESTQSHDTSDHLDPFLTQFKLDFFEFYSLLERTLVHLLGIFNIHVHRIGAQADRTTTTPSATRNAHSESQSSLPTLHLVGSAQGPGAGHSFHQNVLQALDRPGPLHNVLGRGEVREYLDYAKDLRNRWKDVGECRPRRDPLPQLDGSEEVAGKEVPSAEELDKMLSRIFEGLTEARALVEQQDRKSERDGPAGSTDAVVPHDRQMAMDCDVDDVPFEYMEDGMEIE